VSSSSIAAFYAPNAPLELGTRRASLRPRGVAVRTAEAPTDGRLPAAPAAHRATLHPTRMIARAYFQLVDAIAAAHTDDEVAELRARVEATAMHPFERRALERQLRSRELALQVELEL